MMQQEDTHMQDWKQDRIGAALRGENPMVMVRMKSGFAVIGDYQFLPGYCVLLACPQAGSLNELNPEERKQYLFDMTLIGDAVMAACQPLRINYSTLMNADHYLHTHIEARYSWEPDEHRSRPVCIYPREMRFSKEYEYSEEKHGDMKRRITQELLRLMEEHYTD